MQQITEVFYHNSKKELQKLELYNISGLMYLEKQSPNCFHILCIIENNSIIYSSAAFALIEDSISTLLEDLITQPN
jgi:hypothetical protein